MTKQRLFLLATGWFLAAVILAACTPRAAVPVTAPSAPDPAEAPVSGVEVLRLAGDPLDLRLVVRGTLPDACLRAGTPSVERKSRLFEVHLPVSRAATGCPPAVLDYEQMVRLPVEALAPGSYTLLVNGALFTFDLPAAVTAPMAAEPVKVAEDTAAAQNIATTNNTAVVVEPAKPEQHDAEASDEADASTGPAADPAVVAGENTEKPAAPLVLGGDDPPNCYEAALYGEPGVKTGALFNPAETFNMTWNVRNAGTCAWDETYALVFLNGEDLAAGTRVALPAAQPGEVVEVSAPMTAPIPAGAHEGAWAIAAPDGHIFGLGGAETYPLTLRIITRAMQPDVLSLDLQCGSDRGYDQERQVFDLINAERAKVGLKPVEWVDEITQVAAMYSYELSCYDRVLGDIHRGRDGFLYPVRLQRAGILFETSNEMVYAGNGGPAGAVKWWMESPIHKPIMLSERYTKIGIGYVVLPRNLYQQRVTVDFIK